MAERTRSLLSRTAPSGRPTVVNCGKPNAASISTSTRRPSIPTNAPERMVASITSGASECGGKKQGTFSAEDRGKRGNGRDKKGERGKRAKGERGNREKDSRSCYGRLVLFAFPLFIPFLKRS